MADRIKLQFMTTEALQYFKSNLDEYYENYYKNDTNDWIYEKFKDPFENYIEVDYFELCPLENKKVSEVEFENCKIIYNALKGIPKEVAADERLWAGLSNGIFYGYTRKRWGYDKENQEPIDSAEKIDKAIGEIKSRFFFSHDTRKSIYRNTFSKCWWVGYKMYDESNENKFERLDIVGSNDISTSIINIFTTHKYPYNENILKGLVLGIKAVKDGGSEISRFELRDTLIELNIIGGSIMLDVLSPEEIRNLFVEVFKKQSANNKKQK